MSCSYELQKILNLEDDKIMFLTNRGSEIKAFSAEKINLIPLEKWERKIFKNYRN
jgi:hypothetical protein